MKNDTVFAWIMAVALLAVIVMTFAICLLELEGAVLGFAATIDGMMAFLFAICPTLADTVEIHTISKRNLGQFAAVTE